MNPIHLPKIPLPWIRAHPAPIKSVDRLEDSGRRTSLFISFVLTWHVEFEGSIRVEAERKLRKIEKFQCCHLIDSVASRHNWEEKIAWRKRSNCV